MHCLHTIVAAALAWTAPRTPGTASPAASTVAPLRWPSAQPRTAVHMQLFGWGKRKSDDQEAAAEAAAAQRKAKREAAIAEEQARKAKRKESDAESQYHIDNLELYETMPPAAPRSPHATRAPATPRRARGTACSLDPLLSAAATPAACCASRRRCSRKRASTTGPNRSRPSSLPSRSTAPRIASYAVPYGGRPRSMRSIPAILAARAPSSLPHRARPAQDLDKVLQASGGNSADASAIADAVAAARKEGVDPASPVLRKATALLTALETANVDQGNGNSPAKGRGKREKLVPSAETKDETRKREAQLDAIFGGDYDVPELDLGSSEGT